MGTSLLWGPRFLSTRVTGREWRIGPGRLGSSSGGEGTWPGSADFLTGRQRRLCCPPPPLHLQNASRALLALGLDIQDSHHLPDSPGPSEGDQLTRPVTDYTLTEACDKVYQLQLTFQCGWTEMHSVIFLIRMSPVLFTQLASL